MENYKKKFHGILPPQGDYALIELQTQLFKDGILESLGPEPFIPWNTGNIINKKELQDLLPLSGDQWFCAQGLMGISLGGSGGVPGVEGFPRNGVILGYAQGLPGFSCPGFIWNTVRVQTWDWEMKRSNDKIMAIEVQILDEQRIGRGLKKEKS